MSARHSSLSSLFPLPFLALVLASLLLAVPLATAATITWTGGAGTTDYATGKNWDLGRTPTDQDTVLISGANTTVFSSSNALASVLHIASGAQFTVQNTFTWSSSVLVRQ